MQHLLRDPRTLYKINMTVHKRPIFSMSKNAAYTRPQLSTWSKAEVVSKQNLTSKLEEYMLVKCVLRVLRVLQQSQCKLFNVLTVDVLAALMDPNLLYWKSQGQVRADRASSVRKMCYIRADTIKLCLHFSSSDISVFLPVFPQPSKDLGESPQSNFPAFL